MNVKRASIVYGAVAYPVMGLMFFGAAGTVRWLAGWTFFLFFAGGCVLLTAWLLRVNPGLVEERMRIGKNQQPWDRAFLGAIYVSWIGWWLLMPLDAVRFGWSRLPAWLQVAGVVASVASFRVFHVTFRENPFLSGVVRIQHDRGQTVISTGPYAVVRHPMYAGASLLFVGAPLWLGSAWGVLAGLLFGALLAGRAVLEERTLARELAGYDDYRRRVRHRLIPGVW